MADRADIALTIHNALAVSSSLAYVVTTFEQQEAHISPSRLYQYDNGTWRFNEYGWFIRTLALFKAPKAEQRALCIGSEAGDVLFPHDESIHEKIVNRIAPLVRGKRLGRITRMSQIGDYLYACGEGGQTYRRTDDGAWSVLDPALLDDDNDPAPASEMIMSDGLPFAGRYQRMLDDPTFMAEYLRRIQARGAQTLIRKLAGNSEQRIFAAASDGRVLFWNGSAFRDVPTDSKEALTDLIVEGDRVLVCGRKGAFLAGNENDGFHQLSCAAGGQVFTSLASYGGLTYLASNAMPEGLFVSDLTTMQQITDGLGPGFGSISRVQAVDGVLWVFGNANIARYDGRTWTRIDLPKPTRPRKGRNGG